MASNGTHCCCLHCKRLDLAEESFLRRTRHIFIRSSPTMKREKSSIQPTIFSEHNIISSHFTHAYTRAAVLLSAYSFIVHRPPSITVRLSDSKRINYHIFKLLVLVLVTHFTITTNKQYGRRKLFTQTRCSL